ncbi:11686_t:CDS:2 [Diversispora eburnea]|uniref:11686_t:CDS:1 n=1 Tax=Diversispora eburnea TaxID=1213867 RepID=A0A9N9FJX6_9GLOM|nr:11686_t:CDS:2 [Diversispora eburnea]
MEVSRQSGSSSEEGEEVTRSSQQYNRHQTTRFVKRKGNESGRISVDFIHKTKHRNHRTNLEANSPKFDNCEAENVHEATNCGLALV